MGKYRKAYLGVYADREVAKTKLEAVKKAGYKDAFIIEDKYTQDKFLWIPEPTTSPVVYGNTEKEKTQTTKGGNSFAVQIAALKAEGESVDLSDFSKKLSDLGSLYVKTEDGMAKIRLGKWTDAEQAANIRAEVRTRGFKDAILVTETQETPKTTTTPKGGDATAPIEYNKNTQPKPTPKPEKKAEVKPESKANFRLRVAASSDIKKFKVEKLNGIAGEMMTEKTKSGMTLIFMSNFKDLEEALQAEANAHKKGFKDAYLEKKDKDGKWAKWEMPKYEILRFGVF